MEPPGTSVPRAAGIEGTIANVDAAATSAITTETRPRMLDPSGPPITTAGDKQNGVPFELSVQEGSPRTRSVVFGKP